jgi:hypothetical protein
MATTFHVVNFKNKTLDMLTGVSASTTPIGYVVPYNGVQPADPSVAPAGTAEFASYSYGPNLNTRMAASGGGISQLSAYTQPTTPAQAASVATLTFARIYTTGGVAILDCPASTTGGGGSIILDSLTSSAGVGNVVQAFSLKMPINNGGTLMLSASLMDRLVDIWGGGSSVVPQMGVNTNGAVGLYLYSGAAPATADAPATGSLLATISFGGTNTWNAASGGGASLAATPSATASGTGTVGYARLIKTYGANTFTIQGSVGTTATDFVINTTALTSGVTTVTLTEATISL